MAAVGGFALIVGHYGILRARYGEALGSMNPLSAPWYMTAGRIALVLFGVLVVSSLWRKKFRIEYDRWRIGHAVMAVAAVVFAIMHIEGVGHYTRAAWKGYAWMGFSVVWLLVVAYVRLARPLTLLKSPYRVTDVRQEHGSSWTLTVVPEGHAGLRFLPGQFAWLTLRSNPFGAKEHPFSFSGSAQDPSALRFTIKELGDFTSTIKDVQPGEIAYVDGPHGIFSIDHHPEAESFVFIVGGVGIAPIMSMLRTLADLGDSRRLRLIDGNWRWDSVLFREDLELLRSRLNLDVVHVLEEAPPEWGGLKGVLSGSVMNEALPDAALSSIFFLCGPKPMSDSVQRTLSRKGVPLTRIHCELFDMA